MKPRKPLKITNRISSVTNGFVQAIIPHTMPAPGEVAEAVAVLGMVPGELTCVYCGTASTDWDHLRPLVGSKRPTGHLSDIRNMVPACGPCNQSKGGQDWRLWMRGNAKGSPTARNVPELAGKIEALERFEAWGASDATDLEAIVGEALWTAYWKKLGVIESLMFDAQKDAEIIRARIAEAIASGRKP